MLSYVKFVRLTLMKLSADIKTNRYKFNHVLRLYKSVKRQLQLSRKI